MGTTATALRHDDRARERFEQALALENRFAFTAARRIYDELATDVEAGPIRSEARDRVGIVEHLISEKAVYERIDENAKRMLSEVGMNVGESEPIMDLLLGADAVDFDNPSAVFIPLRRDYVDACLERVPREMPADPGPNAFGTGATPPFLKRRGSDDLRSADRREFEEICRVVGENADVVRIFSLPVATDRSISGYEAARCMERNFDGLKMTVTKGMTDDEAAYLKGRDDWLDGTSLITSLGPMATMVDAFLRSARTGNNLLLLDLSIAGWSGAGTPEALLTQIHAQVLFMMVLAQTVNPGVSCVHGGIPGVAEMSGDLSYSSPHQPLINAAMARVNRWVTGLPSAQSGGSTSRLDPTPEAVAESTRSRNTLRRYGVHVLRHAMGILGSLNFFSLEKFVSDCAQERQALRALGAAPAGGGVVPLYFPSDPDAMAGLREIAERGCNPKSADHTVRNVSAFEDWERRVAAGEGGRP